MLIRRPIEAILAEFKRTHSKKADDNTSGNTHIKDISSNEIDPSEFETFFIKKSKEYIDDHLLFLNQCQNNHIVLFDDLKSNPIFEMQKISKFLIKMLPNNIIRFREFCLQDQSSVEGNFHRKSDVDVSYQDKYAVYDRIDWLARTQFNNRLRKELLPRLLEQCDFDVNDYLIPTM